MARYPFARDPGFFNRQFAEDDYERSARLKRREQQRKTNLATGYYEMPADTWLPD